ncbi:MAG TPA: amidohydrolase [Candidatus Limnocylindrales bacterium]|nr:amidohydrolase [Candidatus Limnocylindrales bacterium]
MIYTAKKIITMERGNQEATAVAVSGKQIVVAGSLHEVKKFLGDQPYRLDETFASKVILPGFIDQHLHPLLGALTLAVEVIAPEDWVVPGKTWKRAANGQEYLTRLKQANAGLQPANEWLFTWGYQQYFHGPIDRRTLDSISSTRAIAVWHRSCHEFYLNSVALETLGITKESIQGKGKWSEQSDWVRGHFYEGGLNLIMAQLLPKLATPERFAFGLKQMVEMLHQNGVTAFNEPGALVTPQIFKLYQQILGAEDTPFYSFFIADGRGIVDKCGLEGALSETEKTIALALPGSGKLQFFDKQIKLFADGAIVSQLMQMKAGYTDGHHGEWILAPEELARRATFYWKAGYQIHTHVNGDLGLEVVLNILEKLMRESPRADSRSVIVHFANSTEEQIERIARLGAIVSANPYYPVGFADKYSEVGLGPKRANSMVRSASVINRCIPYSFHSDLPMGPAAPLYLAWCGVNRITNEGHVAGPEQRISVDAGLRAITIEAAYSWRREDSLGSIAPGKIANFTVLERDPYAVPPEELKDIAIWGTVFEGRLFPIHERARPEARSDEIERGALCAAT